MAGTNEAFSRDARLLAAIGKRCLVGNAGPVVGDAVVGADRRRRRELLVARARLAGATEAQAEASAPEKGCVIAPPAACGVRLACPTHSGNAATVEGGHRVVDQL